MKRTVISLIIALSLLFVLGISVYAGEGDTAPAAESAETAEEKAVGAAEDATMSAQLSRLLSENTTEIFSALTLICSLLIAALYKKGLLPSVSKSLGLINESTGAVLKKVCEYSESTDEAISELASEAKPLIEIISTFTDAAQKMTADGERLAEELSRIGSDTERLQRIIEVQNEMLYTVFMSASIPQYQKDALGEVYAKINALTKGA